MTLGSTPISFPILMQTCKLGDVNMLGYYLLVPMLHNGLCGIDDSPTTYIS